MSHVLEARELAFATCCVVQFPPPTYKAQLGSPAFPFDGKIGYLYVVDCKCVRGPRTKYQVDRVVVQNTSGSTFWKTNRAAVAASTTPLALTPTPTVTLTL